MVEQVSINDLSTWISNKSANTPLTAYELEITGLTGVTADFTKIKNALNKYNRYVDVSYTTIPEGVTDMESAFSECVSFTKPPKLPSTVINLKDAFWKCENLEEAPEIPYGVENMENTFGRCAKLVNPPTIPSTVIKMYGTFSYCTSLTSAPQLPPNITTLGHTFRQTAITSAPIIPEGVKSLLCAFYKCYDLENVPNIPDNVTNLGSAFESCTSLTSLPPIPANITQYGLSGAFKGCTNLTSLKFKARDFTGITYQDDEPFVDCNSLVNFYCDSPYKLKTWLGTYSSISSRLSNCNFYLFSNNVVENTVSELNNDLVTLTANTSETAFKYNITDCTSSNFSALRTALVNNLTKYVDLSETEITGSPTSLQGLFTGCSKLTGVPTIPPTVTNISNAYENCSSLKEAPSIPSYVTNMSSAFKGCSLIEEIDNVPEGVTNLANCFNGCTALEKIDVFSPSINVLNTAENCFKDCDSLVSVGINDSNPPSEADQWHIFRLKFGASTVEGEIYDKNGNSVDINNGSAVSITKSTLTLPIKTDEVWFPTGYSDDDDIDEIIEKVIANKYTYFKKETIPPDEKTMVLWADNKDNFKTNIEMGDILDFDTWAEFEQALPNLPVGQKCAIKEGTDFSTVDRVESGVYNPVTSNAVASLFSPRTINLSFIIFGANTITKEAQIFYIGESETYKYYYFSRPLSTYSLTGMVTSNKQIIVYPTNSSYEIKNISLQFFQSANTANSTITAVGSNSSPVGVRFYIASVGGSTSGEIGCFGIMRIAK